MNVNTKEYPPILSTEGNQILCSRGDFALGYKINYPEKYSLGESDFNTIFSDWERSLKQLPTDTIVAKTDIYLKDSFDGSALGNKTFLQGCAARHFDGRQYIRHIAYLFIIRPRLDTLQNKSIKNPFVFPNLKETKKHRQRQSDFADNVNDVIDMITRSGYVSFTPMSEREVQDYSTFYLNGFQTDYLTDLEIKKDHAEVNGHQASVFAITNEEFFPDNVDTSVKDSEFSSSIDNFTFYQGFMDNVSLNLKCNHIYNQVIFLDDHKIHEETLNKNFRDSQGAIRFGTNKSLSETLGRYIQENQGRASHRYVRGHSNIIFWADQPDEFDAAKKKISSELKAIGFRPYFATKERLKNLFLNSFFANVSCLDNNSLYITELGVCCAMFNNSSNYKNDKKGIYFNDRINNLPLRYDFWDYDKKYITSRNFMIVASTGRGKSFTSNHIFTQLLDDNVIHVIIDLGDSYLKMAKLYPPEKVEIFRYKSGEPLGLNPFVKEDESISPEKIEELCAFVWTLIKKTATPTELENTSMRKLITYYYEINETPEHSWENFYTFIEMNRDTILEQVGIEDKSYFNVQEFLHAGSDFVKEGLYANVLRSQDNTSNFIGKKLIIFELNEIVDNKLLLSIMLQVISEAIHRTIWKDRENRGIVFFDEFAKQLEFPEILRSVKFYSQAIRKQNGSLGLVLQTLNQLPDCPESKTVIDNNETFIVLQSDQHKDTIARLGWNEHDASQLYSMRSDFSSERKYSEIYIYRKKRRNVFRIEVSPETYLAYQTEGDIHTRIMRIYERSGSMETAIKEYQLWENLRKESENASYISYAPSQLTRGKLGRIAVDNESTEPVLLSDRLPDSGQSGGYFYRIAQQDTSPRTFDTLSGISEGGHRITGIENSKNTAEATKRYDDFIRQLTSLYQRMDLSPQALPEERT